MNGFDKRNFNGSLTGGCLGLLLSVTRASGCCLKPARLASNRSDKRDQAWRLRNSRHSPIPPEALREHRVSPAESFPFNYLQRLTRRGFVAKWFTINQCCNLCSGALLAFAHPRQKIKRISTGTINVNRLAESSHPRNRWFRPYDSAGCGFRAACVSSIFSNSVSIRAAAFNRRDRRNERRITVSTLIEFSGACNDVPKSTPFVVETSTATDPYCATLSLLCHA